MTDAQQSTGGPRWLRIILLAPLVGALFVWGAGTIVALWAVRWPEGMCKWPYAAWALLWPVFNILGDAGQETFVRWSMGLCQ